MKDKIFNLLLPFSWLLILLFCVFLLSTTSHASGLPYIVDSNNFDFHGMDAHDVENYFNTKIQVAWDFDFDTYPTLMYTLSDSTYDYLVVFTGYPGANTNSYSFTLSQPYSLFDTDINTASFRYGQICKLQLKWHIANDQESGWSWWPYETQNLTLFGSYYYPEFISTNFTLTSSDYDENTNPYVLVNAFENPIDIGVAIIPNFANPNLDITTNYPNPPNLVTPSNPPTFDPTNIPQSTYNLIEWGLKDPNGPFHCLETNISNFFEYIGDCIEALGKSIINNIQNAMTNFYDNMVSLFQPISQTLGAIGDKVLYITAPFDSTVVNAAFTSTNFYSVNTQFTTVFTTFDNAFDIAEPDSFTIIFNVQNITPLYNLGVTSPVTVDLGSNFLPIRAALRTFLWVLVSFGSVFVVEHGLSNWLRGSRKE